MKNVFQWMMLGVLAIFTSVSLSAQESEEGLDAVLVELRTVVANEVGVKIPKVSSPEDVMLLVETAQEIAMNNKDLAQSDLLREIYLEAFLLLYKGRGKTLGSPGWYLVRESDSATGETELRELLKSGVFDETAKERLRHEILAFDFNDPAIKRSRGFPPKKTILTDRKKQEILRLIDESPTAEPYRATKQGEMDLPLAELIRNIRNISNDERMEIAKFLAALEVIHYDRSLQALKNPGGQQQFYGRDPELAQMVDAISRTEKGHFLLTGKAGVGKTTLMRMMSDALVSRSIRLRNEPPPIVLELSILDVTNQVDPTAIKMRLLMAQRLSELLDRRIVLYVDEAHVAAPIVRNAVKSFLARRLVKEENQVHLIFSTTSGEARDFLSDSAFSRRFVDIFVREFTDKETTELIKRSYVPFWKKNHYRGDLRFDGISEEAYEYANKYAWFEQPHAGFPTGPKELLEGTIVQQLRLKNQAGESGPFIIGVDEIRNYIRSVLQKDLIPGDPQFEEIFNKKWAEFEKDFGGNEGLKIGLREMLRAHFGSLTREMMDTAVVFGPPGAGKSYMAEQIARHFFGSEPLVINGSDLKNGGLELNKLLGSPPGTVGSEEQRSVLTKYMSENPRGGIIVIEEADYMHQDAMQLFTNMITKRQLIDGLGKEWNTGHYILILNSNIGQDLMIPPDAKNRMNWEQSDTRRRQLTEKVSINGKEIEVVRRAKLDTVFDQFVNAVVTASHPHADTSLVAQEANKQRRRYKAFYMLPPTKDELRRAATYKMEKFVKNALQEYQIRFHIDISDLDRLIDLDQFSFEKGYSYIEEKLQDRLFKHLNKHLHRRKQKIDVTMTTVPSENDHETPKLFLDVVTPDQKERYELEYKTRATPNPWYDDENMRARVKTFESRMRQSLRGNNKQISDTKALLRLKMQDWNTRVVITQVGTSGNGKTEFFKAMARTLYEDEGAMFKISGLTHKYQLGNYFRPPTGVQGGTQETEFERWFKARMHAGGGIILFDELLSFSGMTRTEIAYKIEVINELYDLLDEGMIRFGNKVMDARGFVIGITGNALQEAFKGIPDDPSAEMMVKRILEKLDRNAVVKYLGEMGIDPPKVARFGTIFVNGPLPQSETLEIGGIKIRNLVAEIQRSLGREVKLEVDPAIIEEVVKSLSTVKLGMREVDAGFKVLLKEPIGGILNDFNDVRLIRVFKEAESGQIRWQVNGREVVLEGIQLDSSGLEEKNWVYKDEMDKSGQNRTPQMSDLVIPDKDKYSPESRRLILIHEVYGHWMTAVLLSGKNSSDTISLIPGDGYAGYVMPSEEKVRELATLKSLIATAVELEAGHRAVFRIAGVYAVGGGPAELTPHGRKRQKGRNDDIGKVSQVIDKIFANQLLSDISELSSEKDIASARKALKSIIVHMADALIEKGYNSKEFEPVFKAVEEKGFLLKEELDQFVEKMDRWLIDGKEINLMESFTIAFEKVMSKNGARPGTRLLGELARRLEAELVAAVKTPEMNFEVRRLAEKIKPLMPPGNCEIALGVQ